MRKILDFVKKQSWIWIIIIVIVAIIGDAYLTRVQTPKATPTPVPQRAIFRGVTPGISSEADLNKIWGTPVKAIVNGNQTTDQYKSTSELRLHSALIENGTVIFIKEIVSAHDTSKSSDITSVYGKPTFTLYNKAPNSIFNLYVYPSSGIAFVGSLSETITEIWYFQPTSLNDFMAKWAQDYSTTPPTQHVQ